MDVALSPRRKPRQERSRITVNAIVEAAARVFTARGFARASTNMIAERAGVSVGSLYQYFPDKLALLRAVHDRHLQTLMTKMTAACRAPAPTLAAALRAIITVAVEHHRTEAPLVRVFARHLSRETGAPPVDPPRAFHRALRELLVTHRAELRIADHELALFVLKNLARSMLRAAVEQRPTDLANGAIGRELLATALGFLTGRSESNALVRSQKARRVKSPGQFAKSPTRSA